MVRSWVSSMVLPRSWAGADHVVVRASLLKRLRSVDVPRLLELVRPVGVGPSPQLVGPPGGGVGVVAGGEAGRRAAGRRAAGRRRRGRAFGAATVDRLDGPLVGRAG